MNYRNKANITLVVVLIAFVLITLARYLNGNNSTLQLLHFVLEAALVGGIADWFAVTAIFRKPFGFPYHTALIPRNREKVIGGVSAMVEKDLLSLGSIRHKLAAVRYDQLIINWLDQNPDARKSAEKWCAGYLQDLSQKLDPADIAGHLVGYAREHLAALDLPQELQKLANWVLETQQDDKLLDYLLDKATEIAARPETRS
ncbi:MAG TPA: DUF445 family protein, partial [Desulfobacteria bacterium]|nr:DUF445 family protein [Desulfobacteria bacterium]